MINDPDESTPRAEEKGASSRLLFHFGAMPKALSFAAMFLPTLPSVAEPIHRWFTMFVLYYYYEVFGLFFLCMALTVRTPGVSLGTKGAINRKGSGQPALRVV